MDWKRLNPRVIREFRANAGKVAGFESLPLLILQTRGARSGRRFDVPLIPVIERDGMYLFGTNAGSTKTPAWVFNVRAHPEIVVEGEEGHFKAVIQELPPSQARVRLENKADESAQLKSYLSAAHPRVVPVFKVEPVE